MKKIIYTFGADATEGNIDMKDILGGKGANLAEMCRLNLPVPPGFTISTAVCHEYYQNNCSLPSYLHDEIKGKITWLEKTIEKKFGDNKNPLFLSVRSGSRSSMPGMMDTILNLGINDVTVQAIADKRFAYDSYRRLIQMYSNVVFNIDLDHFEKVIANIKNTKNITEDSALSSQDLLQIINEFKQIVLMKSGQEFPQNIYVQLQNAIEVVFASWMNDRAISYRKINNIPEEWGTAVNVQAMVFGNLNDHSGSGVTFTRNPSTGANELFGEYLLNAQGEDVVSGIRTPKAIANNMQNELPDAYQELLAVQKKLEQHYRDMQDIEFTVQDKKLWLLQTRNAKRNIKAAVTVAVDLVHENLISKKEAIMRVNAVQFEQLLHPILDEKHKHHIIARGLPAAPGAASGIVVFSSEDAIEKSRNNQAVILVRRETSPEDINGINSAIGILTSCGGMTSHAAVVSRGMGKVCICGTTEITIDYVNKVFTTKGNITIKEGDLITLDGNNGRVIMGKALTTEANFSSHFKEFMQWIYDIADIKIRANADNEQDVKMAKLFKADGIGLCRTEHMFFHADRIDTVRKMIIVESADERIKSLEELKVMQIEDFIKMFEDMKGYPVTIRLLDPPLHEFLPHDKESIRKLAQHIDLPYSFVAIRVKQFKETNPMLGHRGCRLGISHPEIYEMQAHAIFTAATKVGNTTPEIMIPLVMNAAEFKYVKNIIEKVAADYDIKYMLGNMIELPSAALNAGKIAQHSQFFSFGTNDLTQMTLGLSRDDAASFLSSYYENNLLPVDPFVSLSQGDVGELVKIAVERGRATNPNIKIGICGEHGGDPDTVHFCAKLGLDYISCSPYRIPVARLAAAQYAVLPNNHRQK